MLPINNNNPPCDPVSSNCVIWQGPDLPCVDICNGDSISAVLAGLCDQLVILQNCCGSGSGSGSIDITNINQTTLDGGPATTVDQLIQLIIDNINNYGGDGSGSGIWDCKSTLDCTLGVPECLTSITSLNNPETLEVIITYLMNEHCGDNSQDATRAASIQSLNNKVIQLEKVPPGDPNPVLRSACVDKENTNTQPIANLINKIEVDYCVTKGLVGSESEVLAALSKQPVNPIPLDFNGGGFVPSIPQNPTSIAESLDAAWRLIDDLRKAVTELQINTGNNGVLQRMVDINTFYAAGLGCADSVANAVSGGEYCVDIWNSSGIQFDSAVRAYSQPIAEKTYELATGDWYTLCPGTTFVSQYLGGTTGTNTAPFWTTPTIGCGGG